MMYKIELIRRVAKSERLPQRVVADVVNATLRLTEATLKAGDSLVYPGFGKFYPSKRPGGQIKHVKTKKLIKYEARTVAAFTAGAILKRAVAGKRRTPIRSWLLRTMAQKPEKRP
jgi:nucleoid DNA-binding protein